MSDKSYKHFYDDGYTTYHENGSKSKTYPHLLDDGFTTYHDDGSKSVSYKNVLNDGYSTYHYPSSQSYKSDNEDIYANIHPSGNYTPCGNSHILTTGLIVFAYVIFFVIAVLAFLYAGSKSILPLIIFGTVVTVDIICVKDGDADRQAIWAHIINLTMTSVFMYIVDNISAAPKSWLLAIVFYILPLGIIILCVCLNNTINKDEEFMFPYIFIMALTWFFRIIYKKNYNNIYSTIITVESIVLVLMFLIILAITIHSQKKKNS